VSPSSPGPKSSRIRACLSDSSQHDPRPSRRLRLCPSDRDCASNETTSEIHITTPEPLRQHASKDVSPIGPGTSAACRQAQVALENLEPSCSACLGDEQRSWLAGVMHRSVIRLLTTGCCELCCNRKDAGRVQLVVINNALRNAPPNRSSLDQPPTYLHSPNVYCALALALALLHLHLRLRLLRRRCSPLWSLLFSLAVSAPV
jgi:hypothetical protein